MLIFKKEKAVRKLVLSHFATVQECLLETHNVLVEYTSGNVEKASEKARLVNEIESRADTHEREIREALLAGAFLPHVRSDVYRLVESVDAIAGRAEDVAYFILAQKPRIPENYEGELLDIFQLSLDCFLELLKALKDFFKPKGQIENLHGHVSRVCEIETEVDALESAYARRIFESERMDLSEKMHLEGRALRFETSRPMESLATLNRSGARFRSLKVQTANLEDVFLNLTGRRLRD